MPSRFPPGPASGLTGIRLVRRMQRDLLGFCRELADDFGDIVAFRAGPVWMYQFTHPDQIQEVLVKQARKFHKPTRLKKVLGQWDGEGLLLSEGEFWMRQRRLIQQAFHPRRLAGYAQSMVEFTRQMLDRWQSHGEVNVVDEMPRLTLDIVGRTLFGAELADDAASIAEAVNVLQEVALVESSRIVPLPSWLPIRIHRRERWATAVLHNLINRLVRERRATGEDRGDLLSMLLLAADTEGDGRGMTDQQVRDEATTLLLAGHETTAVSLMWTLYYLAIHPEIQQQLAAGLQESLHGREPTIDDLPKLAEVEMAFKEAMRLRGPVYFFSREAAEAVEIAGVRIPKGSQVHLAPYVTHHDPRWFEEPEEFRPERFAPDRERELPQFAYFPFGGGPRVCIGKGMAMMEGTLILAAILQRYQFSLAAGQGDPGMEAQVSLHPRGPLRLALAERKAARAAEPVASSRA